ncbi:DUF1800 domain-containing protein [Massilia sp. CF038]|uniref:DUF1800 domain-containing protein n=1 Tax=Massilia sp. CF038 TaxID=1881045 RepID=UPI0009225663|nr:DUF1800 domain-containing protein [Massilia sp. CF038]SHH08825.1 Uncharacterized conserved protein, DUF1800 family [Massilia sp. CF038]
MHPALTRLLPVLLMLAGCASAPPPVTAFREADTLAILNRVTWGVNDSTLRQASSVGINRYLQTQLRPPPAQLPPAVTAQLAAMTISQQSLQEIVQAMDQRRKDFKAQADDDTKKMAQQAYQRELSRLAQEAASRSLLRALYSPNQLEEQMTWFWLNHFSVHQGKNNLRAMVGDYEERAIRPHALGKFRDLLAATMRHPAMLQYLDNDQNAQGRINENYARELMELHTLGVDGGYSQRDVQELARVLTGLGVAKSATPPKLRRELQSQYLRQGLFEFNPARHDYGDKTLLGAAIRATGLAEADEAIDRLSRHPATARFISRKLATFFVADEPPPALVEDMAQAFARSDGDIATTLETMFAAPAFAASLGSKFKDPQHYALSAVRLAWDTTPVRNTAPLLSWLNRMGQPLYGRQTPDGYQMTQAAWASSGQMTTRFDIARTIGGGNAGLFKADGAPAQPKPGYPALAERQTVKALQAALAAGTRQALQQAATPQEWNSYLLSAPEMMYR